MRNWNCMSERLGTWFCHAPRLPMRNWNLVQAALETGWGRAPRLPMRNWNPEFPYGPPQVFSALAPRLPMRNWNLEKKRAVIHKMFRSQTTYEELKLGGNKFVWKEFESSQTTYEELKLTIGCPTVDRICAPRLPMRNWNESLFAFPFRPECAPRLPMRNWNTQHIKMYRLVFLLPDYLWGIETGKRSHTPNWGFGSQTTYEELKPL